MTLHLPEPLASGRAIYLSLRSTQQTVTNLLHPTEGSDGLSLRCPMPSWWEATSYF